MTRKSRNGSPRDRVVQPVADSVLAWDVFLDRPQSFALAKGFCQAMQTEISETFDPKWNSPERKWVQFPWLTLVLGSGPAGLPDDFLAMAGILPRSVIAALDECVYESAPLLNRFRDDPQGFVVAFLGALIEERVGRRDAADTTAGPVPVGTLASGLVLAAAQLTRTFHALNLHQSHPVPRWGSAVAKVVGDLSGLPDEIARAKQQARDALAFVRQQLEKPPGWIPNAAFTTAVIGLLDAIDADLRGANVARGRSHGPARSIVEVDLDRLRQITDVAWQCLVWDVCGSSYPGWTELLLDLVLLQGRRGVGQRRPRWHALEQLSGQIRDIMRPAAVQSWTASGRRDSATLAFYDAAAELMWQQTAAARLERRGGEASIDDAEDLDMFAAALPKPVAFVTSFDLELEMALLRSLPPGEQTISVVTPVYLNEDNTLTGEFLWLEGEVRLTDATADGQQALDCLTRPHRWRVMYEGRYELPDHPIVVRLTGSPLTELPKLTNKSGKLSHDIGKELLGDLVEIGIELGSDQKFIHAATVDEYLALRQAETEYFWLYSRSSYANINSPALPKALLACREPGPVRFWLTVGVPMRDPAVRLRVLSQMGSRRFIAGHAADGGANGRSGREVPGIAVNWRLDDDDAMLLSSLGMKVIKDGKAEDLAAPLRHHAWHLGALAEGSAVRAGHGSCPDGSQAERKSS